MTLFTVSNATISERALAEEHNPEFFARVSMLYIEVSINNTPLQVSNPKKEYRDRERK
jgi:hypothetical protein